MKRFFISITFLSAIFCVYAEEGDTTKLSRDVIIEREYNPVIMNAKKVNRNLPIAEPLIEKTELVYSNYANPLQLKSPSLVIPQAPLTAMSRDNYKNGFAKLAIAVPLQWDVELGYPLVNTRSCRLDLNMTNKGVVWGKNRLVREVNAETWDRKKYIETNVGLGFDKYFTASNLYADLGFKNRAFNYYGTTAIFDSCNYLLDSMSVAGGFLKRNFAQLNNFSATVGYRALPSEKLFYDVNLDYQLFGMPAGFLEHQLSIHTAFDIPIAKNSLAFDLNVENLLYGKMKGYADALPDVSSVIEFSPKFKIEREVYRLHIGLKSFFAINRGRVANLSPDVEIEYLINPKLISLYLGAAGGYELNSLRAVYDKNYYLADNQTLTDSYTPFDVYGGVKLKPIAGLFMDAFVRYKVMMDEVFFVNRSYARILNPTDLKSSWKTEDKYTNLFTTTFANAQLLNVGLHLNYNQKEQFGVFFKGQYNGWYVKGEEKAWHRPEWEMSVGGDVNITPEVRLSAGYYLAAVRYAKLPNGAKERMRNIHDINLSASYSYSSWLSAFLQVNNLLGMVPSLRYQNWYGYDVLGSVMAGVVFSF